MEFDPSKTKMHSGSKFRSSLGMLQIGQVIFYLLFRQLPEARTFGPFHTLIAQKMVGWRTDDP